MGQQQLLLLVLGAIIVGLAIVVGINLFGQGAVKANEDAVRQDILSMMARAEEFYRKPTMLGGGGKSFSTLQTFDQLGYKYDKNGEVTDTEFVNDNGTYTLLPSATTPQITGKLAENENFTVTYQISIDAKTKETVIAEASGSTT